MDHNLQDTIALLTRTPAALDALLRGLPPVWTETNEGEGTWSVSTELLDDFAEVRAQNLEALRAFNPTPTDLERRGNHPEFGEVTLSQLLATWAAHDLNHLHQIARIMAVQYREAVGPWTRFLGVMQCAGHSAAA